MFITKKKVVNEIAKIYSEVNQETSKTEEDNIRKWDIQSKLNLLCARLKIKPAHLNELGGGTKNER